jgi:hypothetical protein
MAAAVAVEVSVAMGSMGAKPFERFDQATGYH